jgi:hypothetical protein
MIERQDRSVEKNAAVRASENGTLSRSLQYSLPILSAANEVNFNKKAQPLHPHQ